MADGGGTAGRVRPTLTSVLYQLAYMSASSRSWTREELLELLRRARARNDAHAITGVLLHRLGGLDRKSVV